MPEAPKPLEDLLVAMLAGVGALPITPAQQQVLKQIEEDIKRLQVEVMVKALNGAVAANKGAMHALLINRVPVGQEMIDDPFMVVDEIPATGGVTLGMLGVINGLLNSLGMPRLTAIWEHTVDQGNNFVGFGIYKPPKEEPC